MMVRLLRILTVMLLAWAGAGIALEQIEPHKKVIGQTAHFLIDDKLKILARIDTGAATSSVHAINLEVENDSGDMRKNIGKTIHFTLENEMGERWRASAVIKKVVRVKNSQGVERRYKVPLRLGWNTINKTVIVNLRDRSNMRYKLLIGRDWISNEVVVDLERDPRG